MSEADCTNVAPQLEQFTASALFSNWQDAQRIVLDQFKLQTRLCELWPFFGALPSYQKGVFRRLATIGIA